MRCRRDRYNFDASAGAGTGGHKESILAVRSRDGNPLRLVGTAASCCLLSTCRVVMKGFCKIRLEPLHIVERQAE